jgi:hypothetical protein
MSTAGEVRFGAGLSRNLVHGAVVLYSLSAPSNGYRPHKRYVEAGMSGQRPTSMSISDKTMTHRDIENGGPVQLKLAWIRSDRFSGCPAHKNEFQGSPRNERVNAGPTDPSRIE